MDGVEPVDECVVVLYVYIGGGVVVDRVDVVGGVVFAFEDIVVEAVEPLVDRRTESRKVSRRGSCHGLWRFGRYFPGGYPGFCDS